MSFLKNWNITKLIEGARSETNVAARATLIRDYLRITCFLRDQNRGAAPMLALAAIPLLGFSGAAVDYSRAASMRSSMQSALDATTLILGKNAGKMIREQ